MQICTTLRRFEPSLQLLSFYISFSTPSTIEKGHFSNLLLSLIVTFTIYTHTFSLYFFLSKNFKYAKINFVRSRRLRPSLHPSLLFSLEYIKRRNKLIIVFPLVLFFIVE